MDGGLDISFLEFNLLWTLFWLPLSDLKKKFNVWLVSYLDISLEIFHIILLSSIVSLMELAMRLITEIIWSWLDSDREWYWDSGQLLENN